MNEFEFKQGSLEAQGLQKGDEVECTYSESDCFSVGGVYLTQESGGSLYVIGDDGIDWAGQKNTVKFKPISVNMRQQLQGQKLQDILPHCKEGDVLECVYTPVDVFDESGTYPVLKNTDGTLHILSNVGNPWSNTSDSLFIKSGFITTNSEDVDEHDSWGIGKSYTAPKKEWQPDTLDVDLTKKIWEW
ncbi:hypothetical protein [Vibrio phage MZH0603]|nr:hypothetical protein [Vibrio phage MZH0603]